MADDLLAGATGAGWHGPVDAAGEAALLAAFHDHVRETRPVHYLPIYLEPCDEYVTGDSVAEHAVNVTCPDCLEWMHA